MSDDPATRLRRARARIARALLGGGVVANPRLGSVTLRPHQLVAVARLLEIIGSHRGALLADGVGLGKTYVALAIAREYRRPTIVCPAALRGMWERAMSEADTILPVLSVEAVSRGVAPSDDCDLVIVDEAHHLRTPGTRRYETIAHAAKRARMLLLSATPLHNSRKDLISLLALFAGSSVGRWNDQALARLIVRRDDAVAELGLPAISGPSPLAPGEDDDCLDAILSLPPAVPAADEGVAQALAIISLIHLWTSSRAALVASVRKRLARATALHDAVSAGHLPTASELAAWSYADGALQLAFPLFESAGAAVDGPALDERLQRFTAGARALLARCEKSPDPDAERVTLLRILRDRHPGERIVAFSQYAHTIGALGRLMRNDAGVAMVTGAGACIASGSITREEVLKQFSADAAAAHPAERIGLLLTTDLLSEGIDLRGASVIVHLDLPWNPARMEQRVGRSRRLGSRHAAIHVYTFAPPTAAERLIELRRRLTDKVTAARALLGGEFDPFGDAALGGSPVGASERLRQRMQGWLLDEAEPDDACVVSAACAPVNGWISVAVVDGVARLIGDFGAGITEDSGAIDSTIERLGVAREVDEIRRDRALTAIREWVAAREASAGTERQSPVRRAVLDRLSQTISRAPRHRRPATIAVAQRLRRALAGTVGVGVERVVSGLARSADDDEGWLRSVEAFCDRHDGGQRLELEPGRIVAVILLESVSAPDATPG